MKFRTYDEHIHFIYTYIHVNRISNVMIKIVLSCVVFNNQQIH